MHFSYIVLRFIRHFMPEQAADWMKKRHFIIKAGVETMDPQTAVDRYVEYFEQTGIDFKKKTVMIFGYGGNISTGCEFLKRGAKQMLLCERGGLPFPKLTMDIMNRYPDFFTTNDEDEIVPKPEFIRIIHDDIRNVADQKKVEPVDLVLSTSVFEHLDDVDGITRALSLLTEKKGKQVHFVDLRDHYFKYPFEMLTFTKKTWESLLNPTSNLNRFRVTQYKETFQKYFSRVKVMVTESNIEAFMKAKPRIRKEFLSGDEQQDSTTRIIIEAEKI
jgi:hypothetical protein